MSLNKNQDSQYENRDSRLDSHTSNRDLHCQKSRLELSNRDSSVTSAPAIETPHEIFETSACGSLSLYYFLQDASLVWTTVSK